MGRRHQFLSDPHQNRDLRLAAGDIERLGELATFLGLGGWYDVPKALASGALVVVEPAPPPPSFVGAVVAEVTLSDSGARELRRLAGRLGALNRQRRPSLSALLHAVATGHFDVTPGVPHAHQEA